MSELVEGDWKNFTFKMAHPEDFPKILEHLQNHFYRDEPQNRQMGQSPEKIADHDFLGVEYMKLGLSFFAYDRNDNNKIAGVRVTGVHRKQDGSELFQKMKSRECQNLLLNISTLLEEANTFEKLDIDHYGDFLFTSVDPVYRGQGLATEMYKRSFKLLQSKGIPAAQSIFSSPYSQHIVRKLGFVELARKYLADYKDINGDVLFPNVGEDEVAIVMAIKFETQN